MAPSDKERIAAARAAASAKRKAEREAWHRRIELSVEVRRMAMAATKTAIRARGDKLQLYTAAQLKVMADAMIGPWLVEQAKARIAERNLRVMSNARRPAAQGLPLNVSHAQNGASR